VPSDLGALLVAGLSDEFADPVLATSAVELTGWQHGAGTLAVGSAAYDEMDSSAMAFRAAAGLLAAAVAGGLDGKSLTEAAVAQMVDHW
jgi:hypothetical protein